MTTPVVAVVGRPNVGKSTLVNRVIGSRQAIVEERPGVTRDRVLYPAEWRGRPFLIVDTGGLEVDPNDLLAGKVSDAAKRAAAEADVIVLVVDITQQITSEDRAVAQVVRKLSRPLVLVANKADHAGRDDGVADLYELGLGDPAPVSALHGRGVGDLLDAITSNFTAAPAPVSTEPSVAIVGRPNVGKSTLFNRLAGEAKSIVHPEPGTTRDAVDTVIEVEGELYRFVDTAGLRRASRVDDATEYFGMVRTKRALDRCDVALLVVDATEGVSRQDLRIADEMVELGRSAAVVLNKVDLLTTDEIKARTKELTRRLPHLSFAPVVEVSAHTGRRVDRLVPTVRPILAARLVRVPTHLLNSVVEDLQARTPIPSTGRGRRVKYAVQVEVAPPTIILFGTDRIPERWRRYLERGLRERFGFEGTPIRLVTRAESARSGARSFARRSG